MSLIKPFCLALSLAGAALAAPVTLAEETQIQFTAQSGDSVAAFQGHLDVPENRADPDSRMIRLSYVRFPATTDAPGHPIVYLAGGPGGSGSATARAHRFELFMQMRQYGDVIAFDQRGTGDSTELPACTSSVVIADTEPATDDEIASAYRAAVAECGAFWQAEGVDLAGYTTRDSVADLSDLRAHLGAEQIDLWGISYGSHLALAALNEIPDEIGRVVIASAEGLDQTVKLPARTDAYIARLQAAVDSQPAARAAYPDIAGLMRRVHARLEANPMPLEIPQADGSMAPFLLQRHHLQEYAAGLISDPNWARIMLALYASLDAGEPGLAIGLLQRFHTPGEPITLRAMPTAMDLASGLGDARLAMVDSQARDSLLGAYLNFPMPQIRGAWDGFDLGDDFRTPPTGDTPVLLLTGTLDGRTYPEGQAEAVAGLSQATQVLVHNAGHNLFMSSPEVHDVIHTFMRAEPVMVHDITVDLPDFTQLPF